MANDVRHVERVAQMAIVIDAHGDTATPPIDVDPERREPISDAGVDKIHARTKTDSGTVKRDRSLSLIINKPKLRSSRVCWEGCTSRLARWGRARSARLFAALRSAPYWNGERSVNCRRPWI